MQISPTWWCGRCIVFHSWADKCGCKNVHPQTENGNRMKNNRKCTFSRWPSSALNWTSKFNCTTQQKGYLNSGVGVLFMLRIREWCDVKNVNFRGWCCSSCIAVGVTAFFWLVLYFWPNWWTFHATKVEQMKICWFCFRCLLRNVASGDMHAQFM